MAMFNLSLNFNIVANKDMGYGIVKLPNSRDLSFRLLFSIESVFKVDNYYLFGTD